MKSYTPSKLRAHIYRVLDKVVETGQPVAIERKGNLLHIVPSNPKSRLANLKKRKIIRGTSNSIVHCDWSNLWKPKHF